MQSFQVIANGNSPTPLDNTEFVCTTFGVNHTWCPIGGKLIAQFVGARVCKRFPYVIFIDDDCLLPPNFPVVTNRLNARTKCIGYTIKSTGPNGSRGTLCQQAQDLEYKLSGIQRLFAGKIGSATFPHGAISLWDREFCVETFKRHPGFSVSEDWLFGHVARELGSRIEMCTSTFVETETPAVIFYAGGGAVHSGFGEMTVFKQRFKRWNFFYVNGVYYNLHYMLWSWKLGWRELGTKLFVFQEVYETILYLITPFVLPMSFLVRPLFCLYLFAGTAGLYLITAILFNEVHLRMRNQRVRTVVLLYYMWFKFVLTFVNVASCYWSIWKYAKYFAKRHPKVIEDSKVVEVVLRIEDAESEFERLRSARDSGRLHEKGPGGRRTTVTAVGVRVGDVLAKQGGGEDEEVKTREGIQSRDFVV
jgi:Glycosyltransferase like family 2